MSDKIKYWDGCVDPDTKAQNDGIESLSDSELLAVILRTGTANLTAMEVASRFLTVNNGQLLNLYDLDTMEIQAIPGIGPKKTLQLKAVAEVCKRLTKTRRQKQIRFDDACSIASFYMEELRHEIREVLIVSFFDAKGNYIGDRRISTGSLNRTIISQREIFRAAINSMAFFVVVLHNHPSGDPSPSSEDIEATRMLVDSGKLMDIPLLDHIIIGDNTYYSFYESGLLAKLGG